MPRAATGRCWCCGNEYRTQVLRIVRLSNVKKSAYNYVCAECQKNTVHAKTAEEEAKK
jgi:hypothetical protein